MRILFLDDNPHRRDKFKRNAIGCNVDFAITAQQCMEFLNKSIVENNAYDIIFLDHDLCGPESENNQIQDPINNGEFVADRMVAAFFYNVYKNVPVIIHSLNHVGATRMENRLKIMGYSQIHRISMAWARFTKTESGGYQIGSITEEVKPEEITTCNK